jgi:formylglycine-generating enzyme required for sulfatase activity
MGSPQDEEGREENEVLHRVEITRPFHLGVHQVTQAQWQKVMGSNPSNFVGDDLPVEGVSWYDCQDYCKRLGELDGECYRLPTEAEWEYACRAGTMTAYSFGANFDVNQANCRPWMGMPPTQTVPVGSFPANPWGLHDMHGNVWEWCEDSYGPYPQGDAIDSDPKGPPSGEHRVLRGGSWRGTPGYCRSAYRLRDLPTFRHDRIGLRVVLCLE